MKKIIKTHKSPWNKTLIEIKRRCNNPKRKEYKWYGEKGIKCRITAEELKILWFLDKAYEMKQPQISRYNHDQDYTFENCKYEEKSDNISERNRRVLSKSILQYNKNGKFIKEWKNGYEIQNVLGFSHSNIANVCNNIGSYKTVGGFIWKYKTCTNFLKTLSNKELNYHKDKKIKSILQYTLDGTFIKEFSSITEASKQMNCSITVISETLNGKQKSASGYKWRYKNA